jgi:hypothetical protein
VRSPSPAAESGGNPYLKAEYDRLQRRKRRIDWGDTLIDTRGFTVGREEANAR